MKYSISRKGNSTETEVFFNKMIADFYRYMAEFTPKTELKQLNYCKEKCSKHYARAHDLGTNGFGFKKGLDPCNSTRLSVALHFGNFQYEQLGTPEVAVQTAQLAIDLCMVHIDNVPDDQFQEATHICELMRENIAFWKSEIKPGAANYQTTDK